MKAKSKIYRKKLLNYTKAASAAVLRYAKASGLDEMAAVNELLASARFCPVVERWIARQMSERGLSRTAAIEHAVLLAAAQNSNPNNSADGPAGERTGK